MKNHVECRAFDFFPFAVWFMSSGKGGHLILSKACSSEKVKWGGKSKRTTHQQLIYIVLTVGKQTSKLNLIKIRPLQSFLKSTEKSNLQDGNSKKTTRAKRQACAAIHPYISLAREEELGLAGDVYICLMLT